MPTTQLENPPHDAVVTFAEADTRASLLSGDVVIIGPGMADRTLPWPLRDSGLRGPFPDLQAVPSDGGDLESFRERCRAVRRVVEKAVAA
jgi:hypothetical protein